MRPQQVLSLQVRVDLGVMTMKKSSSPPRSKDLVSPSEKQLSAFVERWGVSYPSAGDDLQ